MKSFNNYQIGSGKEVTNQNRTLTEFIIVIDLGTSVIASDLSTKLIWKNIVKDTELLLKQKW